MSTVTSVTKFFPNAKEGFVTTLSGTISAGATTIPLNSLTGYTTGDTVVLVIDPSDSSKKQVVTGVADTTGLQLTGAVWTEGTNVPHTTGATVVDYVTATHMAMVTKGILVSHNSDGTLKTTAVQTALNTGNLSSTGFNALAYTFNTVTYNGNRSYTCVINNQDQTGVLSPGMRIRTTRTVAAPTQSTSLNGTTQYWSKASPAAMTFTDDFVVSAWVKLNSYNGATQAIASRSDGTSGWFFFINSSGQVSLTGYNAGLANASLVTSYQSVPLNKWVHVTAQLDMSAFTATTTTSYVMLDGVDVPSNVSRTGTNPTALIQAGNLNIGAFNGGSLPLNGKVAQVAIYSAKVTQATVQASISQGLVGTETSLISAYNFNGVATDLNTTTANNLTANGSVVATNADSPFGGQAGGTISSTLDYGIIQSVAFSTNTTVVVQVPEGCTIPTSGGVSSVVYSSSGVPYGFPKQRTKWDITWYSIAELTGTTSSSTSTFANSIPVSMVLPIGEWDLGFFVDVEVTAPTTSDLYQVGLGITTSTVLSNIASGSNGTPVNTAFSASGLSASDSVTAATATTYYMNVLSEGLASRAVTYHGSRAATKVTARNAYL